jgi:hypothetical protein
MNIHKKTSVSTLGTLKKVNFSGSDIKTMVMQCRPDNISGPYKAKWDYLESEILSKYVDVTTVSAKLKRSRAIEKLLLTEEQCKSINEDGYGTSSPILSSVLHRAKDIVSNVLGDFDYSVYYRSSFSGGASTSRKKTNGHPFFKYHSSWPTDVTPLAYNRAYSLITATPLWCEHGSWDNLKRVAGNSITTVPKKTDIDRAIAKEPDLNMHMQRSFGDHIRSRLKKVGINLNDQTRNQNLARIGSITNALCTIDLSNASDSLSSRLVWDLLPGEWFKELDAIRSHYGHVDGRLIKWEKFSSMGNGFTFELESLIFYALAQAVMDCLNESSFSFSGPHFLSVYGDDIITPCYMAESLIEVLADVGFKTNTDKTFTSGPFRESCGSHFYEGIDITPFYVRKPVNNTSRVIWLLNRLRLWSYDVSSGICDPSLESLWFRLKRKFIPNELLGGKDINSISNVYSPEQPRKSLLNKVTYRKIRGWRCVLASLQNMTVAPTQENIEWTYRNHTSKDTMLHVLKVSRPDMLAAIVESAWRLVPNETPAWVPCTILFPKESSY